MHPSALIRGAIFLLALAPNVTTQALAQDLDCTAYLAAVKSTASGPIPIVPDNLLSDTNIATRCLIRALENLKDATQTTSFPEPIRNQFLSGTSALRAIISKLNADDEKSQAKTGLEGFIKTFRANDNTTVISVLTYGTRNEAFQVRSNALLVLANVVDNTTVCVPLNHLWDPDIKKPGKDHLIRGRANLLSTISVVAPWAYQENFAGIQNTKNYVWDNVDQSDPNLKQTVDILINIQKRLDSQTENTNKTVPLASLKNECVAYLRTGPRWAPPDKLSY